MPKKCGLSWKKFKLDPICWQSDGTISETDFAELLIVYAGFPDKKKSRMVKRVKRAFGAGENQDQLGISLQDYLRCVVTGELG